MGEKREGEERGTGREETDRPTHREMEIWEEEIQKESGTDIYTYTHRPKRMRQGDRHTDGENREGETRIDGHY